MDSNGQQNLTFFFVPRTSVGEHFVVPTYLNDGLTSIKFPRGKTLKLYGRISLLPAKYIWQI